MTHKELIEVAYNWVLNNTKCGCAFKEFNSLACNGEQPDVIGFKGWGYSLIVECKISMADFLSDSNKHFRKIPSKGMGTHRFYCCPKGLIKKDELPEGWGLIYVDEKGKARLYFDATTERVGKRGTFKTKFDHKKDIQSEHALMYSALRRLHIRGLLTEVYTPLPKI